MKKFLLIALLAIGTIVSAKWVPINYDEEASFDSQDFDNENEFMFAATKAGSTNNTSTGTTTGTTSPGTKDSTGVTTSDAAKDKSSMTMYIIIGVIALVVLIAAIAMVMHCKKKNEHHDKDDDKYMKITKS